MGIERAREREEEEASWEEYCDEQEERHKCHIAAVFE